MKRFIALMLFILVGIAIHWQCREVCTETACPVPEAHAYTGDTDSQRLASHPFSMAQVLPIDNLHSVNEHFNLSSQRYLRHLQYTIRQNSWNLLREMSRSTQTLVAVSAISHRQAYTIGRTGKECLYTYVIRHILI